MRDDHRGSRMVVDEAFELLEPVEVQVVCRLVEQEDVEARLHELRESRARRFAARRLCIRHGLLYQVPHGESRR